MPLTKRTHDAPGLLPDLPLAPVTVVIDARDGRVYGARLELPGTAADWATIQERQLFHCTPGVCGPIFGGAFAEDLPFVFTVALAPEHVMVLAVLSESPDEAHRVLVDAPADSVLRAQESWRLLSVMQQRTPKVGWGLTTTWFEQHL